MDERIRPRGWVGMLGNVHIGRGRLPKAIARNAVGVVLLAGALGPPALALEVGAYDYVTFGVGWRNLEARQSAAVEGEAYSALLSWGVAKQAELTVRATVGSFTGGVDSLESALGGQFHYPFGLRTDVIWGGEVVSREREGQGVSDDTTFDLFAGFRAWPTQKWEAIGKITFIDTLESGDSAFSLGGYYSIDRALALGAELAENNNAETVLFVVRWTFL